MATPAAIRETVEYRVVMVQRDSRKTLALNILGHYCLPRVRIPQFARPAQELRRAIQTTWGLDIFVLDIEFAESGIAPYASAELLPLGRHPDFEEVLLSEILHSELSEKERAEIAKLLDGTSEIPLTRVGWIYQAIAWVESTTGRAFSTKRHLAQFNAGKGFALLGLRSDDGKQYWLKAASEPNAHEASITLLLSNICGGYLPKTIASKPEWNAWLMTGDGDSIADLPAQPLALSRLLEKAVASMAEIQLKTIGRELELLEAGAFDQRLDVLSAHAEALFEYLGEAMSQQTSTKVAPIGKRRIRELREVFARVCSQLEKLALPNSVVHGDINLSNILITSRNCQFIDWSEAYVGNPLSSLQHLLLLNRVEDGELKSSIARELKNKYRAAMSSRCDPAVIETAFVYMPFWAACSTLYGRGSWLTRLSRDHPHRKTFARTVGRYIDRAASDPVLLDALTG